VPVTYLLSSPFPRRRIIGPTFAVDTGFLSLMHSFGVNPWCQYCASWSQETRNIPVSCCKVYLLFWYLDPFRRGWRVWLADRQTDRRTDWQTFW